MLQLYTHAICLEHDTGAGHAESPARLRAVLQALDHDRFATVDRVEAPRATREQLQRVHDGAYVDRILASAPANGSVRLDEDTVMSPASAEAALRAAGAVVAAVDAVMSDATTRAFCAVRPPGHHATPDCAMGFCLFNNIAVGAAHALAAHGLKRIAIADFDVHHGNGTQDIFLREPRVLFISSHQSPLYPGTGREDEHGVGNIVNAPLSPGDGSYAFRELWMACCYRGCMRSNRNWYWCRRASTRIEATPWPTCACKTKTMRGSPSGWSKWPTRMPMADWSRPWKAVMTLLRWPQAPAHMSARCSAKHPAALLRWRGRQGGARLT